MKRDRAKPPKLTPEQLRRGFRDWPTRTPIALLQRIRDLEMHIAPHIRGKEDWAPLGRIVSTGVARLKQSFPRWGSHLEGFRLEWLSEVYERTNRPGTAAIALEARLAMRFKSRWRLFQMVRLVDLLVALDRGQEAERWARKGLRECTSNDLTFRELLEARLSAFDSRRPSRRTRGA